MKKTLLIIFIIISTYSFSLTPEEILQEVDNKRSIGNSFRMKIHLETFKNGKMKDTTLLEGYVKGNNKSMVKFLEPKRSKGRKILMLDNDMWMYFPKTKRPIRITPQQRLMGQVSNGDIASVVFSKDYNTKFDIKENENNKNYFVLELLAKKKKSTYAKIILWVKKDSLTPYKAEFFTLSGKKIKTAFYSNLKIIDGKNIITKIKIEDEINKQSYSTMEYIEIKKENIPDKYFNKEFLKRIR